MHFDIILIWKYYKCDYILLLDWLIKIDNILNAFSRFSSFYYCSFCTILFMHTSVEVFSFEQHTFIQFLKILLRMIGSLIYLHFFFSCMLMSSFEEPKVIEEEEPPTEQDKRKKMV